MSERDDMAVDAILGTDDEATGAVSRADRELANAVNQEMRMASGTDTTKLSEQRADAMRRYYGRPYGNEVRGKSNIRTREVMDTIEWIKPELMKLFSSGGETVRFEPEGPDDVDQAQQETDYCNYVYHRKNNGFKLTYQWITDGLLQKNGIVKGYYDDTPREEREEYSGITEDEMLQLVAPDNVEIIELTQYDDPVEQEQRTLILSKMQKQYDAAAQALPERLRQMQSQVLGVPGVTDQQGAEALNQAAQQAQQRLAQMEGQMQALQSQPLSQVYDLTIKIQTEGKGIVLVNVPPEEFFIDTEATCIDSARFCAHEREITSSELVQMGYSREMVDRLPSSSSQSYIDTEKRARHSYDDTDYSLGEAFTSGANKLHWLKEAYIKYDYDNDGVAELRRVLMVGTTILENDRISCMPFCSWSPIMISHKFYGLSMADIVMDLQQIKTQLFRNILDNQYLANNGRYEVVENMVNYEDLLESRTHGMVRVKSPGMVKRLDTPQLSGTAFQMLQYVDYMRERRTGVSERTQGLDENQLSPNTAASAVNQVMTAAQQRIELIARVFAETGLTQVFHLIHRLAVQHSTRPEMFRLRENYVEANPRSWRHRTDSVVVVGLGNGSRDSEMMQLNLIFQNQQQLSQNPRFQNLVQPENVYRVLEDQVKVVNKAMAGRYYTDPGSDAVMTITQLQQQLQAMTQQMQQMQSQFQQSTQAKALQIEQFRAQSKAQDDAAQTQIKREKQSLDEEKHEDDVALRTAELAIEDEQKRGVAIGG